MNTKHFQKSQQQHEKDLFVLKVGGKALANGQSPAQELEEGPHSVYIWVTITWMDIMPKGGHFFFNFEHLLH